MLTMSSDTYPIFMIANYIMNRFVNLMKAPVYQSYGLVPIVIPLGTPRLEDISVLIVREKRGTHWTFPKGGSEMSDGKDPYVTALRELYEEITMRNHGKIIQPRVEALLGGRTFDETRWRPGRCARLSKSLLSNMGNDIVEGYSPAILPIGFFKRNTFFTARLHLGKQLPQLGFCPDELLGAKWVNGDRVRDHLTHPETKDVYDKVVIELVNDKGFINLF